MISYGLSLQATGYIYSILLYNCGPLGPLSIVSSVNIYKSIKLKILSIIYSGSYF
jgi:hypothetical protein